ncbi:hypothetical protein ACJ2A9_03420 [Anaerobacillus sp. MEB173]|uniref:hypothetical protein n=1 Tax=Anaerobacillus sp. MEB173 TaxID=3383345 RepID=UPI003F930012
MKFTLYFVIVCILSSLAACQQSENYSTEHAQQFQHFEADHSDELIEEVDEEPSELDLENIDEKERADEKQEEVTDEETIDENEQKPSGSTFNTLLFDDFQRKWNALSDEYTYDLYLHSFDQKNDQDTSYYYSKLKEFIHLKVFTQGNNVKKIQVVSTGKTIDERYSMLTSWWQVLLITNPLNGTHDVDVLFADLGVGPNADVTNVKDQSFHFGGIEYTVQRLDQGFLFEAVYPTI